MYSVKTNTQVMVADRRLTNSLTGTLVDDESYKIIVFNNARQGYKCLIAFTGLAEIDRRTSTIKWLAEILPKTMTEDVSAGIGFEKLAQACSDKWSTIKLQEKSWKNISIVLIGYKHNEKPEFINCFTVVISNYEKPRPGTKHKQIGTFNFSFYENSPEDTEIHYSIGCYGNDGAVLPLEKKLYQTFRNLRRSKTYRAQIRLIEDFIRLVAARNKNGTVGSNLLWAAQGADLPTVKTGSSRITDKAGISRYAMPYIVDARLEAIGDITFTATPRNEKT